jgi:transcription initiation factor IIE alpha subunit
MLNNLASRYADVVSYWMVNAEKVDKPTPFLVRKQSRFLKQKNRILKSHRFYPKKEGIRSMKTYLAFMRKPVSLVF